MDGTIQNLVERYNEWRVEQKRCADELVMREYASRSLASEVMMLSRKFVEENPEAPYTTVERAPAQPTEEVSAIDDALADGEGTPEDVTDCDTQTEAGDGC